MVDIDKYVSGLNKTLKGKDDYFFLINDSSNELKQHYDSNYEGEFNRDLFVKSQKSKENYFKSSGVKYGFFVIGDKSVILRDYLPFETNAPIRHINNLKDHVHDLTEYIDESDCRRNDTHLYPTSSLKLVSVMLSILHEKSMSEYMDILRDKIHIETKTLKGDLFYENNYSQAYGKEIYNKYCFSELEYFESNDSYTLVDLEIPPEFREVSERKSYYYINPNSVCDKKALVFHGSSAVEMFSIFSSFYREVFFYWNHGYFNKDLVEWFKPDVVYDILRERFLDTTKYPILDDPNTLHFPVELNVNKCEVNGNMLNMDVEVTNLANMNVPFICEIRLNDDLICSTSSEDNFALNYSLEGKYEGHMLLDIYVKHLDSNISGIFEKRFIKEIYTPVTNLNNYFSNLKGMMMGKDLFFFSINDRYDEIRQHYDVDYNYKSSFNDFNLLQEYKTNFLKEKGISYDLFAIADRSVVLKDKLPFDKPKRFIDKLDNVGDTLDLLDETDYYANDTQLTDKSILKILSYILSKISDNSSEYYESSFMDLISSTQKEIKGNLCLRDIWSYDINFLFKHNSRCDKEILNLNNFFKEINDVDEFKKLKEIKHYVNDNALSDKKLLIFHNTFYSKVLLLLTTYFKEVLYCDSEGVFAKEVVEWFNPDNVIELYSEAFIDNLCNANNDLINYVDQNQLKTNKNEVNDPSHDKRIGNGYSKKELPENEHGNLKKHMVILIAIITVLMIIVFMF